MTVIEMFLQAASRDGQVQVRSNTRRFLGYPVCWVRSVPMIVPVLRTSTRCTKGRSFFARSYKYGSSSHKHSLL